MSWTEVAIGDVATIDRSSVQPNAIKNGDIYVGLEHIKTGGTFLNVSAVTNGELASSKYAFTKNHVLFGRLRPYLAKVALPNFDGICSTDILPILPSSKLDARYLRYVLLQQKMVDKANSLATGANLPRLSPKALCELKIPLPPLAQQQRIAAILDKAAEIKSKREQAIAKLDELAQSTFLEMFGEIKTTNKWERMKISSVSNVYTGKTPPTANKENYADEVPFVTPTDLRGLITSSTRYVSQKGAALIKTVRKGSCLVGCIGDIGRVGYVNMPVTFNQQINAVEWNTDLVDDIFGYFSLMCMEEVLKASAVSAVVPILNKRNFSNISIPIPPISEQRKFSEFISKIWKIEDAMRNEVGKKLFASLQHRAFTTGFN